MYCNMKDVCPPELAKDATVVIKDLWSPVAHTSSRVSNFCPSTYFSSVPLPQLPHL